MSGLQVNLQALSRRLGRPERACAVSRSPTACVTSNSSSRAHRQPGLRPGSGSGFGSRHCAAPPPPPGTLPPGTPRPAPPAALPPERLRGHRRWPSPRPKSGNPAAAVPEAHGSYVPNRTDRPLPKYAFAYRPFFDASLASMDFIILRVRPLHKPKETESGGASRRCFRLQTVFYHFLIRRS